MSIPIPPTGIIFIISSCVALILGLITLASHFRLLIIPAVGRRGIVAAATIFASVSASSLVVMGEKVSDADSEYSQWKDRLRTEQSGGITDELMRLVSRVIRLTETNGISVCHRHWNTLSQDIDDNDWSFVQSKIHRVISDDISSSLSALKFIASNNSRLLSSEINNEIIFNDIFNFVFVYYSRYDSIIDTYNEQVDVFNRGINEVYSTSHRWPEFLDVRSRCSLFHSAMMELTNLTTFFINSSRKKCIALRSIDSPALRDIEEYNWALATHAGVIIDWSRDQPVAFDLREPQTVVENAAEFTPESTDGPCTAQMRKFVEGLNQWFSVRPLRTDEQGLSVKEYTSPENVPSVLASPEITP